VKVGWIEQQRGVQLAKITAGLEDDAVPILMISEYLPGPDPAGTLILI
jgi:hypothetical protein